MSSALHYLHRHHFDLAYQALAEAGSADEIGGAEHSRVWEEYVKAEFPPDVKGFIIQHANRPSPTVKEPPRGGSGEARNEVLDF